jgi:phosphatidylglycerophosphatase A
MQKVALFFASWGYTGYAPVASGTVGTAAAIPFFWLFARIQDPLLAVGSCAVAIAVACWLAGAAEKTLGEHDSGIIVVDEVVGYLAATLLLPPSWTVTIFAFFLFRAFDILKPPPAAYFDQKVRGGAGVVLDDVFAGIYANLATRALLALTGPILG